MSNAADRNAPPVSTRFRKGRSGNPRGRPRKKLDLPPFAFDVVIDRKLTIVQGGEQREVTVDEALRHKIYQKAIAGNRTAQREVLRMIDKRDQAIARKAPRKYLPEILIEEDPKPVDDALLILGIVRHDPKGTDVCLPGDSKRLLLEAWAVKAALSRRAGSKLTREDLDNARRRTHDAETIAWPATVGP